jgi:hypothetical protein
MSKINNLLPILTGQALDADTHRLNFNNIAGVYNNHDKNKVNIHGVTSSETISTKPMVVASVDLLFPIGTVIQVWDNNITEVKALINSEYMKCMNGQTVSDAESLFNGVVLPDISEAYLMCCLDNINATKVGDSKSSLTHSHEFTHSHTSTHTHTIPSHNHTISALDTYMMTNGARGLKYLLSGMGSSEFTATHYTDVGLSPTAGSGSTTDLYIDAKAASSGTTSNNTGTASAPSIQNETITSDSTIYTENRQLRSIKCRYYVRIK